MSVIILLISFGLIVSLGFLAAFIWAVKSGQFEDKFTPSIRMLMDDKIDTKSETKKIDNNQTKRS